MRRRHRWLRSALGLIGLPLVAASPPVAMDTFVTLGTQGGPVPSATRSQPANVLIDHGVPILVDAGDGVSERLAAAGVSLGDVHTVFLSHLHFDHTAGLAGVLGLRYATSAKGGVTIYGPPGTKALVAGLVASMQPAAEVGYGLPGAPVVSPSQGIAVVELVSGSTANVGDISVKVAENSHYSFPAGSPQAARFKSLSFRFDLPDRSIVYTGDTGPSVNVERLAHGADLLVSEVIDLQLTEAVVRRQSQGMSAAALAGMMQHLSAHHLTPEAVGQLARNAGVKAVVLTHQSGATDPAAFARYRREIAKSFSGPVAIANDLDRF